MHIHHLNCISTCPLGGKLMDGTTRSILERGHLACHCLLLETSSGLVLVDAGLGRRDVADPARRLSRFFLTLLRPEFRDEMTAYRQIERLGLDPRDVRHIVLTHLDFDHAGGLDDFPDATVHMLAEERDYALLQRTWLDRQRYRPQQWSTRDKWRVYSSDGGDDWLGLKRVRALHGLPDGIAMIPLIGHTFGHAGIAVDRGDKWLLQAGDAYFYHEEMDRDHPRCTPGLAFYQWMMDKDRSARKQNQQRLREVKHAHAPDLDVFCGHDVIEFERLSGRSARVPVHGFSDTAAASF